MINRNADPARPVKVTDSKTLRSLRSDHGNTTIEYAVILGAVVLTVSAGMLLLGQSVNRSTRGVTAALSPRNDDVTGLSPAMEAIQLPTRYSNVVLIVAALSMVTSTGLLLWKRNSGSRDRRFSKEAVKVGERRRFVEERDIMSDRSRIYSIVKAHRNELSAWTLRVSDVMSKNPKPLPLASSAKEVRDRLASNNAGFLLVTDRSGAFAGAIYRWIANETEFSTATEIVSEMPHTVEPNTHLPAAVELMHRQGLDWVPVVDGGGSIVGMLTKSDIYAALLCVMQILSEIEQEHRAIMDRALGPLC